VNTETYGITNPTSRSATVLLAVAYAAFLAIIFLRAESGTWAISIIPTLPLLPLAVAIHLGSLGWIRIREEEIEIVPSWFRRKFWGEQSKSARFDASSELLFCRRFAWGALDGFFVILRPISGPDQVVWSTSDTATGVSREWWSCIAQEIGKSQRLRTRLVDQTINSYGTAETDWKNGQGKSLWKGLRILIATTLLPWVGIAARLLTPNPAKLTAIGVILWMGAGASVWYWLRSRVVKLPEETAASVLLFTLQFATFYTLAVLVTGAVLHH